MGIKSHSKVRIARRSSASYDYRYNIRQPATYSVIKNGREVGIIRGSRTPYMGKTDWVVDRIVRGVPRELKTFYGGTRSGGLANAKEFAIKYFGSRR